MRLPRLNRAVPRAAHARDCTKNRDHGGSFANKPDLLNTPTGKKSFFALLSHALHMKERASRSIVGAEASTSVDEGFGSVGRDQGRSRSRCQRSRLRANEGGRWIWRSLLEVAPSCRWLSALFRWTQTRVTRCLASLAKPLFLKYAGRQTARIGCPMPIAATSLAGT